VHRNIRNCVCRRLLALAAGLVLMVVIVVPATAAEPAAPKSKAARKTPATEPGYDRVAAKQAYEEALRAFNLGHWQEAVAGFEKSYTLSGDAALLFNVAQAQRQAGNVKEAIIAYKAFLREKPDTPHREMIEDKVKELEAGAETKTSGAKPADSKAQPDRLTGVWVDPFEGRKAAPVGPSPAAPGVPTAAPAATAAPAWPAPAPAYVVPSAPQPAPTPPPPAAAFPVYPAPAIGQEPAPMHELDLSQRPAAQEPSAGSGSLWWLWTGIGAVVAAGVVTAVILSTRNPGRDVSCLAGVDGCVPVGK
jgi:hypothetical protein